VGRELRSNVLFVVVEILECLEYDIFFYFFFFFFFFVIRNQMIQNFKCDYVTKARK